MMLLQWLHIVEAVNELVLQGLPFRDAYKRVGAAIEDGSFKAASSVKQTHEGSIGNLQTEAIGKMMQEVMQRVDFNKVNEALNALLVK